MSFCFPSWTTAFSPKFHESAKATLEAALNKGKKPPVIQGRIEVVELNMGKIPPTLTLLEVGDLSLDRFRGIFRLGYQGDAWLEVKCRVQANPLSHNPHVNAHPTLPLSGPLLASQPLLVPMTLRLSSLNLRAILILVVSKSKGITLVFKNDPLQNVDVSSTFDSIEVIRGYLQQEIEGQLREMFREDLPGIIHRLSQKWFTGAAGMGGRVEMPYRNETLPVEGSDRNATASKDRHRLSTYDDDTVRDPFADPNERDMNEIFPPYVPSNQAGADADTSSAPMTISPSRRRSQRNSIHKRTGLSTSLDSPTTYTTFPEIEDYDPTYGLRPEGVPSHSGYEAFGRLWEKARQGKEKGLGSLMSLAEDLPVGDLEADEMDELYSKDGDEADEGLTMAPVSEFSDEDEDVARSIEQVENSPNLRLVNARHAASSSRSGLAASVVRQQQFNRQRPSGSTYSSSLRGSSRAGDELEWETVNAKGGGTVSRPRIFHSQSQIKAPSDFGAGPSGSGYMPSPSGTIGTAIAGSNTARASSARSSAGGSTVGLGVARSLLDQASADKRASLPAYMRSNASASVSMGHDVFSYSGAGSASISGVGNRAIRRHSRADSVPISGLAEARVHQRQPSRLNPATQPNPPQRRSTLNISSGGNRARDLLVSPPASTSAGYIPGRMRDSAKSFGRQNGYAQSELDRPSNQSASLAQPITTPPRQQHQRRSSSSGFAGPSSSSPPSRFFLSSSSAAGPKSKSIVLPLNDSVSQLATLSYSNHTLSPYARNHEHIAIRSFPHLLSRTSSIYGHMPQTPGANGWNAGVSNGSNAVAGFTSMSSAQGYNGPSGISSGLPSQIPPYTHHYAHHSDPTQQRANRKRLFKLSGKSKPSSSENISLDNASADARSLMHEDASSSIYRGAGRNLRAANLSRHGRHEDMSSSTTPSSDLPPPPPYPGSATDSRSEPKMNSISKTKERLRDSLSVHTNANANTNVADSSADHDLTPHTTYNAKLAPPHSRPPISGRTSYGFPVVSAAT